MNCPSIHNHPRVGAPSRPRALALAVHLAAAGLLALPLLPAQAQAQQVAQQQVRDYDVPAGPLATALNRFATQAGIYLSGAGELGAERRSPGLQGRHSVEEGLRQLLAGTGLAAQRRQDGSYRLTAVSQEPQPLALQPVTVTGEKMDRSLQDTATAVTVLSAAQIDTGELDTLNEIAERVPNMITHPDGVPNIRGMEGTGPSSGVFTLMSGARPRVSTSIDGVTEPWSGQAYLDNGLWDVEQVEVLRGPQSTTQGRNTIGGAIVVNTKDPTFDWEGGVRAGYASTAGDATQELNGVISGPLIDDELAFRVAASGTRGDQFIDYPLRGDEWPWEPDRIKRQSVRGKLLWEPLAIPELSAKLTVAHRTKEGAYLNRVNGENFWEYELDGTRANTRYTDSDSTSTSLDVTYRLSDAWTSHFLYTHSDYDAYFEQYNSTFAQAIDLTLDLDEASDKVESRLVYDPLDGPISGVMGIYAHRRDQDLMVPKTFIGDDKTRTLAVYGEGTFAVTDRLNLIAGGRVEREHQQRDVAAWPGTSYGGQVETDIEETMLLPKVGLDYALTPDTRLGFTVRQGYNAGGGALDWDTAEFYEYDKEEVITYEASLRGLYWDDRLSLNANLFYNQYDDYQALLDRRFANIPEGETYGLELDATVLATEGLEVSGALGLLDSRVTAANARNPEIQGNEFSYAPRVNARLGLEQHFDSGLFVGGDVNYVDEYFSSVANDEALKAGGYTQVNVHTGYATRDYTVRLFARNLLDEEVLYSQGTSFLGPEAQVGAPRTVGVTLDYRF